MKTSKVIVGFALFGENCDKYAIGVSANIRAYLYAAPGYKMRFHFDEAVKKTKTGKFIIDLTEKGIIESKEMPEAPLTKAMLWRIDPIWNSDADYVFSRDLDALLTPRELECNTEFMRSGMILHTIHDSCVHVGIMGGLCGFETNGFRDQTGYESLEDFCASTGFSNEQWSMHGMDQIALNTFAAPLLDGYIFEHMFNGWNGGKANPVTSPRKPSYRGRNEYISNLCIPELDSLASHMGAAGFDVNKANEIFKRKWQSLEMDIVDESERAAGL